MSEIHYYETSVHWKQERIGSITADGMPEIEVATPPEFPKGVPNIWSPEHLFIASANVCLMTTFLAIAENSKLDFKSFLSNAKGKIEKVDGKFMMTEINLNPKIEILAEKDFDRAMRIIEKSEAACLISNSMKTKIILNPEITIAN